MTPIFLATTLFTMSANDTGLTDERATSFAKLALRNIVQEYPNKTDHVLANALETATPRALHPAFYGSFDWHSCVHGHWMLVKLLKVKPNLPIDAEIRTTLDKHLTAANLKKEAEYFERKESQSFERPYGWAWLLKLAEELHGWDDPLGRVWARNLQPLVDVILQRAHDYYPKQTYPTRSGVHSNTSFGLAFAHDYAVKVKDEKFQALIEERAKFYFGKDEDAPAKWEPGGADFFSPSLMEADLMRRVLAPATFDAWLAKFLPALAAGEPKTLLTPALVTDRSDPHLVHLDGLNLSRAWCLKSIGRTQPADSALRIALEKSAGVHAAASLPHVASGDYAGEHWLASFAVCLLTQP